MSQAKALYQNENATRRLFELRVAIAEAPRRQVILTWPGIAEHCHSAWWGPIARGPTLAMDIRQQPIDYTRFTPGVVPYLCAIVLYMLSTHQRMTHLQTFPFQRVLQDQAA
jgi:hypothetical protein